MTTSGKRMLLGGGVLVALAGGLLVRTLLAKGSSGPPEQVLARKVVNGHYVRVNDGDELIYAGIRAPYSGEALFHEAKKRNEELVEGRMLRLKYEKKVRDSDGRYVAYAYVEEKCVNEQLVHEGLAYVQLASGEKKQRDALLAAQSDARARRVGVWGLPAPSQEASYIGDKRHAVFHRPSCALAKEIRENRQATIARRDDAFDQGLAPCRKCFP